ncbi:MAG: hypothetical protein SWK76_10575 [Actinomycetota bacterium]|nr:hypothetical protein [Actinomycetota bacterium]
MQGLKDHQHLMTICHCCPRCCLSTSISLAFRDTRDALVKLEGLKMEVESINAPGAENTSRPASSSGSSWWKRRR